MAKEAGIKIAVNTDAHSIAKPDFISAGINQSRRAWVVGQFDMEREAFVDLLADDFNSTYRRQQTIDELCLHPRDSRGSSLRAMMNFR